MTSFIIVGWGDLNNIALISSACCLFLSKSSRCAIRNIPVEMKSSLLTSNDQRDELIEKEAAELSCVTLIGGKIRIR
jgi:hypothetical protein